MKGITIFLFFSLYSQVAQGSTEPKNQRRRTSRGCGFGPRTSTVTTWPLRAPASEDWNYGLPIEQRTNAKLLAAAAPIILTDDYHEPHHLPTCLPARPRTPPTPCPPGHNHDSQVRHYKNICLTYDISINTLNTCFMPLPPAASPPAAVTGQVTLFSQPHPLPCLVDLYSWHYQTHFPSLTMSLTVQGDGRRRGNQRLWRRESRMEGGG